MAARRVGDGSRESLEALLAPDESKPDVEFVHVHRHFGAVRAVDDVSFAIAKGSFHSFLGPSGCGKTTSLRLIAGFEQPDAGEVRIAGRNMVGVPAHRRPVNMVFQHYALFPHLDVFDNVAYGLRQQRPRPVARELTRRVEDALALVRMPGLGRRRVWELSGGQQQRVALARALVNRPTLLLLDEPLSALDRKLRRDMQIELQTLQREVGITFVLVTHDQEEALSMSDTVAIMREGKIVQLGTPAELYDAPANRYVADFVGESNFFPGEVVGGAADHAIVRLPADLMLAASLSARGAALGPGMRAVVAVRPEAIRLWPTGDAAPADLDYRFEGLVRNRIYLGDQTEFSLASETFGPILARVPKETLGHEGGFLPGARVGFGWRRDRALALADT
jgi:spermidine/putrescine transport system ATP-binding protein